MSWAAADECGKEAEEVTEDILTRYFRPQLEECHLQECQEDQHSRDPIPDDQDSGRHLYGETDHHSEDEDWTKTTVAEEWNKHRSKHNSGEKAIASFWSVFGSFVVLLLHFVWSNKNRNWNL